MKTSIKYLIPIVLGGFLASCSNSSYISENDVYMQAPTKLDLNEDQDDITSFNAFKARQEGLFQDEYMDPRANPVMIRNQFALRASYMPFGMMFYNPTNFHGMSNRFYFGSGVIYTGHGMGLTGMYGNPYNSPFGGYDFAWNNNFNPYGTGYYNGCPNYGYNSGSYYGGGYATNNAYQSSVGNVYYGPRNSMTSSSRRSSFTSAQGVGKNSVAQSNHIISRNTMVSKSTIEKRNAGGRDYTSSVERNTSNSGLVSSSSRRTGTAISNSQRNSSTYSPSSSARRSGISTTSVSRTTSSGSSIRQGTTATPSNRGVNTRTSSPRVQQSTSRQGSFSTSTRSSSSRGSGSSSSSSSRRR